MLSICFSYFFPCLDLRMGDYKLLVGDPGMYSGWYPPDKVYTEDMFVPEYSFEERLKAGNESYYKLFNLKGRDGCLVHVCSV